MGFEMTDHARQRWAERFPDLCPDIEWGKARRLGKKLRRELRSRCPAHRFFTEGRAFRGRYFMASARVIFVMAPPERVVTVFPVDDDRAVDIIDADKATE